MALAKQWHPDRVGPDDLAAKRRSMEASAAINVAYRALRDPVTRLEYLVKLGGVDLDSSDPKTGAPAPTQAFLVDMIERREGLSDARQGGTLAGFRGEVEDAEEEAVDAALAAITEGDTPAAAQSLVQRRYWQRLLDEIDDTEHTST